MALSKKSRKFYSNLYTDFCFQYMKLKNVDSALRHDVDTKYLFPYLETSKDNICKNIITDFISNKFYGGNEQKLTNYIKRTDLLYSAIYNNNANIVKKYINIYGLFDVSLSRYTWNFDIALLVANSIRNGIIKNDFNLSYGFPSLLQRSFIHDDHKKLLIKYLPEFFLCCGDAYNLTDNELEEIVRNINISSANDCHTKYFSPNDVMDFLCNSYKKKITDNKFSKYLDLNPNLINATVLRKNYINLKTEENRELHNIRVIKYEFSKSNVPIYFFNLNLRKYYDTLLVFKN